MAPKRGPKPGAKSIKPLSDRDRWNAGKKSRSADDGEWKVIKGVLRLVKKK